MEKIFGEMDGNIQNIHSDDDFWFGLFGRKMGLKKVYPFAEGDTYFTIEDGQVVESTWDCVSEEIFDDDVEEIMLYFKSEDDANKFLKQTH